MIAFPDAKKVAGMLAAVGEPTRMRILYRLAQGPHHVGQLAEMIGVPMVNMSHHLGVMRQAGLLEDEKDGRRVIYRFRPEIYTQGGEDGILATLALGLYRLVIKKGASSPVAAKARRKPARKAAPRKAKAAD
ncbi:MAG: ArsR family transcriptional regulator [Gemmataceae bacterium]|nr:ArsR family transcriptional regulator [Gemmataceae bacterium]